MAEEKSARQLAEEALAAEGAAPLPAESAPVPAPAPRRVASDIECAVCGRDGGPVAECEVCAGNMRFAQTRAFTLSEERQGLNPDANKDRYGLYGNVSPNIVVLPGGFDPHQGNKK